MKYLGIILFSCSMLSTIVCLEAGEMNQPAGSRKISDQVRSSVNRLKSFSDESVLKQYAPDPQREKDLQRLLPNYQVTKKGTSSREVRNQSVANLRKIQLTPSGRKTTNYVIENMSQFRRMPEVCFEVHPETYEYFTGHPDVVVSLWQAMGVSAMKLKQTGKFQYELDNNDGTISKMYYLHKGKNLNVVYCKGEFKSPLLKNPISAQAVLILNSKFEKQKEGTTFVRHSADVIISFPNAAIETAARLISPVSNYIADRNFQEISLFMHTISLTMAKQPSWLQQMADQMQGVHPDRSQELRQVILENYKANQQRLAIRWNQYSQPVIR